MFVDSCIIVQFIKKQQDEKMFQNFYYSIFIWSSKYFGRHIAHYQEPKTALAASGFSYVDGCWTCSWWTLSGTVLCLTTSTNYRSNNLPRIKNQRLPVQFWLLMIGGVSPETCWASYKYGIIKILKHFCILLDFSLWIEEFKCIPFPISLHDLVLGYTVFMK